MHWIPEGDAVAEHEGNSLDDQFDDRPATNPPPPIVAHPVPHPGCIACDPAIVASRRAHSMGAKRTRPPGTPNGWQMVADEGGGVWFVPPPRSGS
jgi:hypothetical protein